LSAQLPLSGHHRLHKCVVFGEFHGNISAKTAVVAADALVQGDIIYEALAVHAGGIIEGRIQKSDPSSALGILDSTPTI